MNKAIKSLIVTPDSSARNNLKEAIMRVIGKCSIFNARTWKEARAIAIEEGDIAAIFIRSTIKSEEAEQLQDELGRSKLRYMPLYFVMLHSDHNQTDYVSNYYLGGIEGFLQEPFATEDVDNAIRLAIENRERQITEHEKELEALQFMLRDGCNLIDEAALERHNQSGRGGGFALRRMKRLRMRIQSMKDNVSKDELTELVEKELTEAIKKLDLSLFKKKVIKVEYAEHPGKILGAILEERSLSSDRLCELIQVDDEMLMALLEEKESVSGQLSKELARVIGNTPEHWLSLQSKYDAYVRSTKH